MSSNVVLECICFNRVDLVTLILLLYLIESY